MPIHDNPNRQQNDDTFFDGEVQEFSGEALAADDPSLEPRQRLGRPTDHTTDEPTINERSAE